MKIQQHHYLNGTWLDYLSADFDAHQCQLVLAFGSAENVQNETVFTHLKQNYPSANIILSSTAGEIINDNVFDESVAVTAIQLEKSRLNCVKTTVKEHESSCAAGKFLINNLDKNGLRFVFVISDGMHINGSDLIAGINSELPEGVLVTGGLAGDADRFNHTYTGLNAAASEGNIILTAFYGDELQIGHGSSGGWDEFGPERTITKSDKNVLYEIDGKNALDLYKQYLGDYVNELPGSALLFPISLHIKGSSDNLVRTILSINEQDKTMTFAGNLPEGSKVRLMKANFDKLIDASSKAAGDADTENPQLAILVSCVGRKLVLLDRTDEEIMIVKEALGDAVKVTGFYSYGELSPYNNKSQCELHNQTMTITTLSETN
ncbi:FIST signal transduction protein [Mucilaginibacter jinjuensis]|uniref:FIST N-terminal domain-containing protein n=1 Tax=Mucilaginibacter jinjuensis TaxID=1176721 RepID=A0ABY7T5G5_9SPHI|nr:FIST N-terminal domain-containing protein [Mucilaginibacter jinjuensis]WCT10947.1 FIST N-terminal domain-containing protein [Mucilaginibacter jinjuensis]